MNAHEHTRTHTNTRTHTHTNTRTNTNTRIIHLHHSCCEGGCPPSESSEQRSEQKGANHHGDNYSIHPPRTLRPPTNSIGGAHHPRSVVSTRQAATCCDSTPLTHGTGRLGRLSDGLSPYTTSRHTRSPTLCGLAACHKHIHSPTRSQLTATEPKLVESDDMWLG